MTNPAAAVVLDVITYADGVSAVIAFWLAAPATRVKPIAVPTTQTQYTALATAPGGALNSPNSRVPLVTTSTPNGVTLAELNAIENGYLVESIWTSPKFSSTAILQAAIIAQFTALQTPLTASGYSTNLIGGRFDNTGVFVAPAAVVIPTLPS